MKTRTKAVLLVLCAMVLVFASVLGTMAYLTSTDEVTNTFTVGNVQITLDEAKVDEYGNAIEGAQRVKKNDYKLIPGHEYVKDPTVTVKAGSEKSYVRMIVTIDKKEALDAIGFDMRDVFVGENESVWIPLNDGVPGKNDTMVYEFRYFETVSTLAESGGAAADKTLEPLFTSIKVPGEITNEQLKTLEGLKIDVVAHAIQADGFAGADAAWTAFDGQTGKTQ